MPEAYWAFAGDSTSGSVYRGGATASKGTVTASLRLSLGATE